MKPSAPLITRQTLLLKAVDPQDNDAWADFVDYYGGFIFHIIGKMGVPHHDQDDLAQQIVVKLWQKLETYDAKKGQFSPLAQYSHP